MPGLQICVSVSVEQRLGATHPGAPQAQQQTTLSQAAHVGLRVLDVTALYRAASRPCCRACLGLHCRVQAWMPRDGLRHAWPWPARQKWRKRVRANVVSAYLMVWHVAVLLNGIAFLSSGTSLLLNSPRQLAATRQPSALVRPWQAHAARSKMKAVSHVAVGRPALVARARARSGQRVRAQAVAPDTAFDRAELDRLKSTDAFAELVDINQRKQSVNRPQKVLRAPHAFRNAAASAASQGAARRACTQCIRAIVSELAMLTGRLAARTASGRLASESPAVACPLSPWMLGLTAISSRFAFAIRT